MHVHRWFRPCLLMLFAVSVVGGLMVPLLGAAGDAAPADAEGPGASFVASGHRHDHHEAPGHRPHREPDGCDHHCTSCGPGPAPAAATHGVAAAPDLPSAATHLPSEWRVPLLNLARRIFHPPIPTA